MKEEQNVFIPAIEVQKAAKEAFGREGKISFVLTKRDAAKIEKRLKIIESFLRTKEGSMGVFKSVLVALKVSSLKLPALLFNERLNSAYEFFENNYRLIGHHEISVFERNNKMKVITFYAT